MQRGKHAANRRDRGAERAAAGGRRRQPTTIFRRVATTGLTAFALTVSAWIATPTTRAQAPENSPIAADDNGGRVDTLRLNPEQQRELEHLIEDLRDSRIDIERRRRAASILLDRGWPAAVVTLHRQLGHAEDPNTKRAICQAIALTENPSPQLVDPLVALLGSDDAPTRSDAAAALARYDTPDLVDRLIKTASTHGKPGDPVAPARLGSIQALAEQRNPQAVHRVIDTILKQTHDTDQNVRAAAFASLTRLTGIVDFGSDADAWDRWWKRTRRLSPERLLAEMMRNLAARSTEQANQLKTLTERLVDANKTLYDAAAEDQRPAILQKMIDDDMDELRLLALSLIERRTLNAQPVSEEVRAAMRQHLTDRNPQVRATVAQLFDRLGDSAAAERVVELVLGEWDPTVQSRYFGLLASVPKAGAVEPALLLLERDQLRNAVAAFLAAAADADLLTPNQSRRTLDATRRFLDAVATPEPNLLRVLGRLGGASDLPLLAKYLDNPDAQVRLAAAEPFRMDRWPVTPMLKYLGDQTLGPVAIEVVSKRASDAASVIALLQNKPTEADRLAKWNAAVLAVTSRLNVAELAKVDTHLIANANADQAALHEELLKTAAGLTSVNGAAAPVAPETEAVRNEAALRLAAFYARHDEAAKARTVYQRLAAKKTLDADTRARLASARIDLALEQKQIDEAVATTKALLAEDSPVAADVLALPWLDAVQAALSDKRPTDAKTLIAHVDTLLGQKLNAANRSQLDMLKKMAEMLLAASTKTSATAATE